jgi:transposase IS66 family protein/uncharacterized protein DUF6444
MEVPDCPGCQTRDARIAALENEVRQLREELRHVRALLGRNAGNSSLPPSANPPSAPAPVVKPPTGRRRGAQPDHPPHLKQLVPPERVTHGQRFVPSHCSHCHHPLPAEAGPDDPEPTRLCWAHLRRDFQALVDLGGAARRYGEELLDFAEDVFHWWHRVRDGTLTRGTLRTYVDEHRPWLRDLLARGRVSGCAKTAALCEQLQELEPALWTFVRHEGVEPTNNHAERVLRKAVLWRKKSFGCVSENGCRFVERILTVVQTRRLQGGSAWKLLQDSLRAYRSGQPAPRLIQG